MKKLLFALTAIIACSFAPAVLAQDESLISKFVKQATGSGDSQLGSLASTLTDKLKALVVRWEPTPPRKANWTTSSSP